jgi:hypothetical protein
VNGIGLPDKAVNGVFLRGFMKTECDKTRTIVSQRRSFPSEFHSKNWFCFFLATVRQGLRDAHFYNFGVNHCERFSTQIGDSF